jgi:hypothetical protein
MKPAVTMTVLLVDRPAIVEIFAAAGVSTSTLAVTCIDGTPRALVTRLTRAFRSGERAAVLYLHDSATIIYPFTFEPIATLVASRSSIIYRDLGLPPLGTSARRFGDPTLGGDPIRELAAIPPAALVRYCVGAARSLVMESDDRRRETSR